MTNPAQTSSTFPRAIFQSALRLIGEQRWLGAKDREFTELLEACPSDLHRQMLIDLLGRTTYVSASEYVELINAMREHVETVWCLDPKTTLFVSSNNKDHIDSSKEVLNQLKSGLWTDPAWKKQQFYVSFRPAIQAAKDGDTLVVADDFVGSGESMLKALKWFADAAADAGISVDLRVLTAAGCEEGISNIQAAGYAVQCMTPIKKGLSDYLTGQALVDALSRMNELEDILETEIDKRVKFSDFRLGWRQQQAVYVRHGGNTPNNVFPVFWWRKLKNRTRNPVMHRT